MTTFIYQNQSEIEAFCDQQHIKYLGIFGSYARGEATGESDLDVLIEFSEDRQCLSLMDFIALQEELGKIFQIDVDLVRASSIKPEIAVTALEDLQTIYPFRPS